MAGTLSFDVLWRDHQAQQGMKNLGERSEKLRRSLKAVGAAGAVAMAVVGAAAVKFGADSVRAYADAETKQVRLQDAFRKFPKLADTNISSLRALNTELAKKTKFDDDATASGQAVLAQFNLTGKQITQLTPLLQDYAAKTGKDLPTAARDLGKAVLGQGRSLKAVGINFKDTGTQAGNLEQITKGLRTQVGGFAEKEGKTAAGQAEILRNQWGELQESVGKQLLPVLIKLAKWVSTHQADLISLFIGTAKGAITFGITLAQVLSGGLRGFGLFADGIGTFISSQINWFGAFLNAATLAFGWVPGIGAKLTAANINFTMFASSAERLLPKVGDGARGIADSIDNNLIPSLTRAGGKVDEFGRKEILKAEARDAVNRAAIAVENIGTKADGSQVQLKRFADISRLSAGEQTLLRGRITAAKTALGEQLEASRRAGGGQKELTETWKRGKQALYDEFRQMGLSKKEAQKLADKYAGIPPKAPTKIEQPGMKDAKHNAKELKNRYKDIPKSVTTKINWDTAVDDINTKLTFKGGKGARLMSVASGGVLPGWSPGRDVHQFHSATGGVLNLSGGEAIMRPEWTRAVGGPSAVNRMNAAARGGSFASGGVWGAGTDAVLSGGGSAIARALRQAAAVGGGSGAFGGVGRVGAGHLAAAALARVGDAWDIGTCLRFVRMMAGAPGGTYDASAAWANARYKHRGDRNAPSGVPMYWGGGHGHIAVSVGGGRIVGTDFPRTGRIGLASAARLTSAWGKPYLGWANDVNGVVTSRYGLPAMANGGLVKGGRGGVVARIGEGRSDELVTPLPQNWSRMIRAAGSQGVGNTIHVHMSAPNYVGSQQDLLNTMVQMAGRNQLSVVLRKAGVNV